MLLEEAAIIRVLREGGVEVWDVSVRSHFLANPPEAEWVGGDGPWWGECWYQPSTGLSRVSWAKRQGESLITHKTPRFRIGALLHEGAHALCHSDPRGEYEGDGGVLLAVEEALSVRAGLKGRWVRGDGYYSRSEGRYFDRMNSRQRKRFRLASREAAIARGLLTHDGQLPF